MNFHKIITAPEMKDFKSTIHREAARAIIMADQHILLVQSNRGDYKFPGGGVEQNESHSEALLREVIEETGYINCLVLNKVGIVVEQKMDEYDSHVLFQMTSHYYLCDLEDEEKVTLKLDKYESDLDFRPVWVSLDDAIRQNEKLMRDIEKNSWLMRETLVLRELAHNGL